MEHVKSTLVTTAVLVAGLITAAHVLHPYDPALEMRRAKPVAAGVGSATAWSDPPARETQVATGLIRPASFTLLPVAMTVSLSGTDDLPPPRSMRRAEHGHARKPARFGTPSQSASITARAEPQVAVPVASATQPGKASQGDPIGDLMEALGLGRDSEG